MSTQPSHSDPQITAAEGTPGERTGLLPGTTLAGRYEIDRLIGEGGMGDVYLAKHLKIDKLVAIKVLAPEQTRRPRTVSRFLQEAKAASKIRHDNVVDITDFGDDAGRAFFVMEYFEGEDLRFMLKREGRISWRRARAIAIQLLEGLGAAHNVGIVHRDVKPHNCFITPRESNAEFVKIIDFGIAKLRDGSEEQLTRTGAIMGTAEYMSPEQGQGAELDGRSDLYSVGVILYRMLTGDVPFSAGNAMAILYQHVHTPAVPPTEACPDGELGPDVDALVAKALAKDPDERFASAREFVEALRAIDDPLAGAAGASSRRGPWLAGLGLAVAAAIGAAGWIALQDDDDTRAPAQVHEQKVADASAAPESTSTAKKAAPNERPPNDKPPPEQPPTAQPTADAPTPDRAAPTPDTTPTPPVEANADAKAESAAAPSIPVRRSKRRVDTVLGKLAAKVRACGKKSGLFPGEKVDVKLTIGPEGRPSSVKVSGSHAAAGEACMVSAIKRARFGAAQRSQSVDHRFTI